MPPLVKIALSALVLALALLADLARDRIGMTASPFFVYGLAAFMVVALWMFPEPRKEKLPKR